MDYKEWLNNDELAIDIWNNKYRYNNESLDEWFDRVSGGDEEIKQAIKDKKFIFAGRILANRGTNKKSVHDELLLTRLHRRFSDWYHGRQ